MKLYLNNLFSSAAEKLPEFEKIQHVISVPKQKEHGDLSSNAAMLLSKILGKNPRVIAADIIKILDVDKAVIDKVEIAGPGFINFFFTPEFISGIVKEIIEKDKLFGRSDKYKGLKANVEFVSANPTGPLTVGHGRNAVVGDTISSLLEWVGYDVDREYYFNNAGRQMRVLGDSLRLRYLQLLGKQIEFPDDYYHGVYISEIAQSLYKEFGDQLINDPAEGKFKEKAEKEIFNLIKQTLSRLDIKHKIFFNENSLYESGKIENLLKIFEEKGISYKHEGAVWLKFSQLGKQDDKVIVKSTGEPTYRLPDIAYHSTKFERGYDLMVDIFGSDHAATYPDVLAGLTALGFDQTKVKVLIQQFVTVTENGAVVKMSTRKANYITLDDLIDEVGKDVVRYFYNMRNISSHMNFELSIAKKQSDENPVFYLQYAHARICSIIKTVKEENLEPDISNLSLLQTEEEQNLIKILHQFEDEILYSAEAFETHRICIYLEELAAAFHKFYTFCRILGTEKKLAEARLALAVAVKIVLRNGLSILGVSAPERM